MAATRSALRTSLERLSSGRRINSASEDVAGLSQSVSLDSEIRSTLQAIRNANDGMAMLSVAEGAMNEMTHILQGIRELAIEAASGTITSNERKLINEQAKTLLDAFDQIASRTSFNGIALLDGSFGSKTLHIGPRGGSTLDLLLGDLRRESVFQKTVGTGAFWARATYAAQGAPYDAVASDFDGDGIKDLATVAATQNGINILKGNGDGTFKPRVSFGTGNSPMLLDTADFNNDGILDLVNISLHPLPKINIHLGNGDMTFRWALSEDQDYSWASSVKTGDFNGDGNMDVVAADVGNISLLMGNGDGTFQSAVAYEYDGSASGYGATPADINKDGHLDLITTSSAVGSGVFLNNGDGTFRDVGPRWGEIFGTLVTDAADVTGDGKLDLVMALVGGGIAVAAGNGDGTFLSEVVRAGSGTEYYSIKLADVNNDGAIDIVAPPWGGSTLQVFLGNNNGTFRAAVTYSAGTHPKICAAEDLNQDGSLDLLTVSDGDNAASVFLGITKSMTAISDLNLTTQARAEASLALIDNALKTLARERTSIGSTQGRLEAVVNNLYVSRETLAQAYCELVDSDIALETAEMVRNQILQNSAVAMLSQANLMQARVLELLKD